jgi:hypothetical protein
MITRPQPQRAGILRPQTGVEVLDALQSREVHGIGVSQTTRGTTLLHRRRRPASSTPDCPFRVRLYKSAGVWQIEIGQGYVFAGSRAQFNFSYDGTLLDDEGDPLSSSAWWAVPLAVAVDSNDGYFTASLKPIYNGCLALGAVGADPDLRPDWTTDMNPDTIQYFLATFRTDASGVPVMASLRQDQWSHIYAPVHRMETSAEKYYSCSLDMIDYITNLTFTADVDGTPTVFSLEGLQWDNNLPTTPNLDTEINS